MKVGLIDVDGFGKVKKFGSTIYPNIALAKLSAYHKRGGASVEWYTPFEHYDVVYMSKVFSFTPDYCYIMANADKVVRGGTGYDIKSALPEEIDMMQPDYSIYPSIPDSYAYGFTSRGCIRKCPWCVVPKKEGSIKPYMDVEQIAIDGRTNLVLMDNNILAAGDYAVEQLEKIIAKGYHVDYNQALDARLVNERFAKLLAKVNWLNHRIRFGCDTPQQIEDCEKAISLINSFGYRGEYFLYTILTDDFKECLDRLSYWWKRNRECRENHTPNIYPFAQPYRDPNSHKHHIPQWQKDMAAWVNKHQIFQLTDFANFEPRKGFKCREYLKGGEPMV